MEVNFLRNNITRFKFTGPKNMYKLSCSLRAVWLLQIVWKSMIRKLKSGEYRLYSRKADPKTKKRRNLGTFKSREAAEKHEREVQYFKRH
jgi:hypothetical protein